MFLGISSLKNGDLLFGAGDSGNGEPSALKELIAL